MPWDVFETEGRGYCVFKLDEDGEPTGDAVACHDTEEDAEAQVRALYASEEAEEKSTRLDALHAVKALGQNRVGGYLVLWGDAKTTDLSGEYFTAKTTGLTQIFDAVGKVPLLYQHGTDDAVQFDVVGAYDVLEADDIGLWAEAELNKANKYKRAISGLVDKGALGQSSQSLVSARKVAKDGHIQRWVIAEGSLTPTPCEPRMMQRPVEAIKAAYKALSLELPEPDEEPDKGAEEARRAEALALERERIALLDLYIAS